VLRRLTARLAVYPPEECLLSEEFLVFLQKQDLVDPWREKHESALGEPNLYGNEAIRHALILFLQHLLPAGRRNFPGSSLSSSLIFPGSVAGPCRLVR